jgi:hypothetical protein
MLSEYTHILHDKLGLMKHLRVDALQDKMLFP